MVGTQECGSGTNDKSDVLSSANCSFSKSVGKCFAWEMILQNNLATKSCIIRIFMASDVLLVISSLGVYIQSQFAIFLTKAVQHYVI